MMILRKFIKLYKKSRPHSARDLAYMASAKGDAARDRRDWTSAILHYQEAVRHWPAFEAIWVQLGHAKKELGKIEEARLSYERALSIRSDNADTHLQLGHAFKLQGDLKGASLSYARAFRLDPDNHDVRRECIGISLYGPEVVAAVVKDFRAALPGEDPAPGARQILIDVTALSTRGEHSARGLLLERIRNAIAHLALGTDDQTNCPCVFVVWDDVQQTWISDAEADQIQNTRKDTVSLDGAVLFVLGPSQYCLRARDMAILAAARSRKICFVAGLIDAAPYLWPEYLSRDAARAAADFSGLVRAVASAVVVDAIIPAPLVSHSFSDFTGLVVPLPLLSLPLIGADTVLEPHLAVITGPAPLARRRAEDILRHTGANVAVDIFRSADELVQDRRFLTYQAVIVLWPDAAAFAVAAAARDRGAWLAVCAHPIFSSLVPDCEAWLDLEDDAVYHRQLLRFLTTISSRKNLRYVVKAEDEQQAFGCLLSLLSLPRIGKKTGVLANGDIRVFNLSGGPGVQGLADGAIMVHKAVAWKDQDYISVGPDGTHIDLEIFSSGESGQFVIFLAEAAKDCLVSISSNIDTDPRSTPIYLRAGEMRWIRQPLALKNLIEKRSLMISAESNYEQPTLLLHALVVVGRTDSSAWARVLDRIASHKLPTLTALLQRNRMDRIRNAHLPSLTHIARKEPAQVG